MKLRIKMDGKEVICGEGDYEIELDSDIFDKDSSQCKLTIAKITASGYTKENELVECVDEKYNIGDIWFKNRSILIELAQTKGFMVSAWCRLEQERTYMLYERNNYAIAAHYQDLVNLYYSGEGELDEEPDAPTYYDVDNDSTISDLTAKEEDVEIELHG